jgi:hypothetical protein
VIDCEAGPPVPETKYRWLPSANAVAQSSREEIEMKTVFRILLTSDGFHVDCRVALVGALHRNLVRIRSD